MRLKCMHRGNWLEENPRKTPRGGRNSFNPWLRNTLKSSERIQNRYKRKKRAAKKP